MTIEQPQESIEDRIFNQFNDQPQEEVAAEPQEDLQEIEAPTEEESDAEAEAQPEFVEVEYGGKSYQVPPELKDALMAQSDYTKKTTEVAETRRLVELEKQQLQLAAAERDFHKSVNAEISEVQRIDFQIEQYKSIDATGLSSDQLWQLSRTIEQLKDKQAELKGKINEKYQQYQGNVQKLAADAKQKALEIAQKSVPNWSEATQKQIREHAASVGFNPDELNSVTDPRVVKVLWQASQYAKLQTQKVASKVTNSPSVKPGSANPMPQAVKDKFAFNKQMKSAQTSAQKAKLIEKELMRRF